MTLNTHNKTEYEPAHIARKKSKCDYFLNACPTDEQVATIVDLSKLPEDASETIRIVRIGNYDDCACIGSHVGNTSEIGIFRIISYDFSDGVRRVRRKVTQQ